MGEDDGQSHCCSVPENCTALTFVHIHCSYYTVYLYSTGGANCLSRIEGQLSSVYAYIYMSMLCMYTSQILVYLHTCIHE